MHTNACEARAGRYRLGDEQGIEAYYNLAVTPWLRVAGTPQWISPTTLDKATWFCRRAGAAQALSLPLFIVRHHPEDRRPMFGRSSRASFDFR